MDKHVNGVFEGGGVRGVALAGAAASALEAGYSFDHLVGTSAGALVASLLAAGYDSEELSQVSEAVDWPGLLDPVRGLRVPLIGRHIALVMHRGLYRGERLESVWSRLLLRKGVVTFADLSPDRLDVIATDINHSVGVKLPSGLAHYGVDPSRFPVARAVRMSSAVPFLFKPVPLHDRRVGEKVLMADGAMAANFPVGVARRNLPVLGFRLVEDDTEHPHVDVRGPASLARSIVVAGIRARYTLPLTVTNGATIVYVPVSSDLDFSMTGREARAVFERGRAAAAEQLETIELAV
jgi:NTE family protein